MIKDNYNNAPEVIVDLRKELPAVRDQGNRPLCLVFAASDAHTKHQAINEALSVEYLAYYAYQFESDNDYSQGLKVESVQSALERDGQPHERMWPYRENPLAVTSKPPNGLAPIYRTHSLCSEYKMEELKEFLERGNAVVFGAAITLQFTQPADSPFIITDISPSVAMHAMVAVGYGVYPDGEALLLARNSWGDDWGDGGYAWLTSEFVEKNVIECVRFV